MAINAGLEKAVKSTFKRGESLVLRGKGKGIMNAAMALLEN
jgi:hypothetical protein